jgi:hypothetical protein
MALNIDADVGQGIWCEYDEDVSIKIKAMTPEFLRKSKNKFVIKKKSKRRNAGEEESFDEDGWDDHLVDYVIEDWKGIVNTNNETVPCVSENKKILMDKFSSLKVWILQESRNLAETIAEVKSNEIKNS